MSISEVVLGSTYANGFAQELTAVSCYGVCLRFDNEGCQQCICTNKKLQADIYCIQVAFWHKVDSSQAAL